MQVGVSSCCRFRCSVSCSIVSSVSMCMNDMFICDMCMLDLSKATLELLRVYDPEGVAKIESESASIIREDSIGKTPNTIDSTPLSHKGDSNADTAIQLSQPLSSIKLPSSVASSVTKSNANSENTSTSSAAAAYIGKVLTLEERAFLLKDASRIPNINLVAMLIVFLPYLTYLLNEG